MGYYFSCELLTNLLLTQHLEECLIEPQIPLTMPFNLYSEENRIPCHAVLSGVLSGHFSRGLEKWPKPPEPTFGYRKMKTMD